MNLGNKIREFRRTKGLTQEQLATALSISPQAVSKWEMGASYPDMTMIPVIAGFFGVSLDTLFDFDANSIDKKVEDIRLEYNKYFWSDFERAEEILLEGLQLYPASIQLKTELFELYSYNIDRDENIINKAFELASQIIHVSQDVFCTCRTKANLIRIYEILDKINGTDHYEEIKSLIESLPYMYPYMIQDRMRLTASYIKGEEGMREAQNLKRLEWQELFSACYFEGRRYFKDGDYVNALESYSQSVDVIERFMYPDKRGCDAYPICGTHSNHSITLLDIAQCHIKLGQTDRLDELLDKSWHIYFDAYEEVELWDYASEMREMMEYYEEEYNKRELDRYRPLDFSIIEKRIVEKSGTNE